MEPSNKWRRAPSCLDLGLPAEPAWELTRHVAKSKTSAHDLCVLCLAPQGDSSLWRLPPLLEALRAGGCQTVLTTRATRMELETCDVVLAYHPHVSLHLMDALAAARTAGRGVALWLDTDLEKLPSGYPEARSAGLNTPARIRAYTSAILQAETIFVHSLRLEADLRQQGLPAQYVPEAWSDPMGRWQKPARPRRTLNLGWIGAEGQVEDVMPLRRTLLRVMREFPFTQLVIAGDDRVYSLFDGLPEARRIFLPAAGPDDLPYLLGQVDILLAPLNDTAFNRTISDRRLLEAGLRSVPWLASPVPAFKEWKEGGLIVQTPDGWHTLLRQLIIDPPLRASLGQAGQRLASTRHLEQIAPLWLESLRALVCRSSKE